MKKTQKQNLINNEVLVQKAKLLNTAGKSTKHIREALELSAEEMNTIRTYLLSRKQWTYNGAWAKRTNKSTKSVKSNKTNKSTSVKSMVVKESRKTKAIEVLNINFKGINVEIQKSSNIIVTENTIYVK